jgi:hypothetical protein
MLFYLAVICELSLCPNSVGYNFWSVKGKNIMQMKIFPAFFYDIGVYGSSYIVLGYFFILT